MSDRLKPLTEALARCSRTSNGASRPHVDLTERVRAALPGPEKDHVVSASYRDDTLVVLADSAAWCPQIRYAQRSSWSSLRAAVRRSSQN